MESFGEYLRNIRKQKGLGVEQIAEKTRINPRFIKALEEERFEKFPGETFAKGFVRSYARSLGLDEMEVLRFFKEASSSFYLKTTENEKETAENFDRVHRRRMVVSRLIQGGILVFIGLAVWLVYDLNSIRFKPSPPPTFQTEAFETPAPGTFEADAGFSEELETGASPGGEAGFLAESAVAPGVPLGGLEGGTGAEGAPGPAIQEISSSVNLPEGMFVPEEPKTEIIDPLILVIEAVEDTWILARIDENEIKEVYLRVGEKVTWKASEQFLVDFGNAGGVNVSLDGEFLPSLGESGEVVKKVLFKRE